MLPSGMQKKITSNAANVDLRAPGRGQMSRWIVVGGDGNLVWIPGSETADASPGAAISWAVLAGDVLPIEASAIDSTNTALPLLILY